MIFLRTAVQDTEFSVFKLNEGTYVRTSDSINPRAPKRVELSDILYSTPNRAADAIFLEFKYLSRRIMRLADLPAWSSTASTGGYVSILSPFFSRGFLIRVGRCLPPPVVAMASNSNVGGGASSHMFLPSRTAFLQMEAAHEAAACQVGGISFHDDDYSEITIYSSLQI